jgi:hypothetical protein
MQLDPPKERNSALEIVSSQANPASPQWSEHRTDMVATSPWKGVDEQESEGLPIEWDEDWEHGNYDFGDSSLKEFDGIFDIKRHITLEQREMTDDNTLDMVATSDTEPEQHKRPALRSPALRLVWEGSVSNHQQGSQGETLRSRDGLYLGKHTGERQLTR